MTVRRCSLGKTTKNGIQDCLSPVITQLSKVRAANVFHLLDATILDLDVCSQGFDGKWPS